MTFPIQTKPGEPVIFFFKHHCQEQDHELGAVWVERGRETRTMHHAQHITKICPSTPPIMEVNAMRVFHNGP